MSESPLLVSVVVISHNSEKFIKKTLLSILGQTYKSLEVIVVDDGSTDASCDIILNLSKEDGRIILLNDKTRLSRSEARNYGVQKASSDWVAFCDSDDLWREDKIQKQVDVIYKNESVKLVFTGSSFVDENDAEIGNRFSVPELVTYKTLLKRNSISCSSVLAKKDVYQKTPMSGDYIDKPDRYREDYFSWLGILKDGNLTIGIDQPLLIYRIVNKSVSSNKIKAFWQTYRTIKHYTKNGFYSLYCCFCHVINANKKYRKVKRITGEDEQSK